MVVPTWPGHMNRNKHPYPPSVETRHASSLQLSNSCSIYSQVYTRRVWITVLIFITKGKIFNQSSQKIQNLAPRIPCGILLCTCRSYTTYCGATICRPQHIGFPMNGNRFISSENMVRAMEGDLPYYVLYSTFLTMLVI